jgi:hypothetical protein
MHFMNPVPVMKLVEVVPGQATSRETADATVALALRLGKTPVVSQDLPGFISNRILMPMINEAIFAVMEGVGSAEAIDTVMKLGMNHPMGPLTLADFIGLDVCLGVMRVLEEGLGLEHLRPPRILEVLTERRSTFSRGDLNRELAKVIIDPKERAVLNDQILTLPEVVGLKEAADAPVSRYTTRTVLKAEDQVIEDAAALAGQTRHGLTAAQGQAALDRHAQLSAEQRGAFWHATQAGGLAVIAGESGAGKSTVLAAVRDSYEVAGYRVIGMAWTNALVQDMRRDGYREATTIASGLRRLDNGANRWDTRTVLIVDEAGMLSTKHLAALTSHARSSGAKLILAGDDKQLASIERGGLFGALKDQHGGAELHEVVRVSDAEQKRAFNLMHKGEFLPALAIFANQGALRWSGREAESFEKLVTQWGRDPLPGSAPDNKEIRDTLAALGNQIRAIGPPAAPYAASG